MDAQSRKTLAALAAFVTAARKVTRGQADLEEARARRVVALDRALAAGLSTEELAGAVGVSPVTIRQWRSRGAKKNDG